jgi:dipeptidyl aminopeptidase/acylaminoacyl peptidase
MKKIIAIGIIGVVVVMVGWWLGRYFKPVFNPRGRVETVKVGELEKYDFDRLRQRGGVASEIKILGEIREVEERRKNQNLNYSRPFTTKQISFETEGKKMTGMMNLPAGKQVIFPEKSSPIPVVIMVRGYAEKVGYYSGSGSWRVADRLAEAGIATISLDFLGYAQSDGESLDMLAARFEKVTALMDLVASVRALPWVDKNRIGFWAHSNGGQIVLSTLEAMGGKYPTVLWAPMTNPFPKSVIDTASDLDDGGKVVKMAIANFEKKYDVRRYAFENYYDWIQAPILIHQGPADEWCKVEWQEEVVGKLKSLGKNARLEIHPGDDHNFKKSWEGVVTSDLEFFKNNLNADN